MYDGRGLLTIVLTYVELFTQDGEGILESGHVRSRMTPLSNPTQHIAIIPVARIETHSTTSLPGEKSRRKLLPTSQRPEGVCSADFGCRVNSAAAISRKEAVSSGERREGREWEDRAARNERGTPVDSSPHDYNLATIVNQIRCAPCATATLNVCSGPLFPPPYP
ncbi:hypothetical protein WN51_14160 [Melipona quadrifasciata]|uniref:Uncharacterized protein n=1 Tax=Melipona quadrifasciata TaxID=166423 RepID=A0A0M8ZZ55_9HYME|nr:hypothetical protein WN51_14160 [Melipona quadrifasciata]